MSVPPTATPAHEVEIGIELVAALLDDQFPELAAEPLSLGPSGWDNALVRIGDSRAARLPRRELAAQLSPTELDWLPRVSAHWTFPVPVPLAVGQPGHGYPWRWSIVPWLDGTPALTAPLRPDGAAELGAALAQVHVPAPAGSPRNPFRSQSLESRRERIELRFGAIADHAEFRFNAVDATAALDAADAFSDGIWCHLDVHGNNVLTRDGRLAGIIDWGDAGNGDPATDLGQAWYLVGSESFEVLAEAYLRAGGVGDPRAPRVRAEAVNYAVTMASLEDATYAASGWKALADLGLAEPT